MLKLIGGRLYQWDLGRQMELHDPDGMQITEVDFCHPDDAEALVVIPDRSGEIVTVDIPNILLQSDETIMVYECVGDVTISHIPRSVVGRARPADYVYTETQVLTYKALEERIAKLEQGGAGGVGTDGGYYSPNVDNDGNLTWTPSADNMPTVTGANIKGPQGDTGPQGPQGNKGETGATGAQGPAGADGSPGADGADGVGIQSVVQTTTSAEDGGTNVITVTKTDGSTSTFEVRNGSKGNDGAPGADGKDGADGQPGADGKSAYQYAQDGGYTGTEAEFAAKLAEEMPDALPNPNALTFTGAVTGTYDGSAPVSVEIPSGGSGGSDAWNLIDHFAIEGAAISYEIPMQPGAKEYGIYWVYTNDTVPQRSIMVDSSIASFGVMYRCAMNEPLFIRVYKGPSNILATGQNVSYSAPRFTNGGTNIGSGTDFPAMTLTTNIACTTSEIWVYWR